MELLNDEAERNRAAARFMGVYTIPVTPFHEDGSIDFDSLKRCVEFCLECGTHGIVMPVNASEFFTLSDSERVRVITAGVEANGNAVPFVAGVSGVSPQHVVGRVNLGDELRTVAERSVVVRCSLQALRERFDPGIVQ